MDEVQLNELSLTIGGLKYALSIHGKVSKEQGLYNSPNALSNPLAMEQFKVAGELTLAIERLEMLFEQLK